MEFIVWILLGLVAGFIAKWIMPGKGPGGLILTILLGIAGSFVGVWLGNALNIVSGYGFSLLGIVTAVCGSLLILFVYSLVTKK